MVTYAKKFGFTLFLQIPILVSLWIIPYTVPEIMLKYDLINGNTAYIFVLMILSSIIQFGMGYGFYIGAYKSIRHGSANMDVLVVLGTTSAWLYGIVLCGIGHTAHAAQSATKTLSSDEFSHDIHLSMEHMAMATNGNVDSELMIQI